MITRRTFHRSVLAGFLGGLLSSPKVFSPSGPAIPWQQFCGASDRFQLHRPWVAGGVRIATDRSIAIWQPTREPDTPQSENELRFPPLPNLVQCWTELLPRVIWRPYPEDRYEPSGVAFHDECLCCFGRETSRACASCHGVGYVESVESLESECDACAGNGAIPSGNVCRICQGNWAGPVDRYMRLGNLSGQPIWIDRKYAQLVRQCHPLEWGLVDGPGSPVILIRCQTALIALTMCDLDP